MKRLRAGPSTSQRGRKGAVRNSNSSRRKRFMGRKARGVRAARNLPSFLIQSRVRFLPFLRVPPLDEATSSAYLGHYVGEEELDAVDHPFLAVGRAFPGVVRYFRSSGAAQAYPRSLRRR